MVEVQQCRLGTLEDHFVAGVELVPAEPGGVGDERFESVAVAQVLLGDRVQVQSVVDLDLLVRLGFLVQLAPAHGQFLKRLLLVLEGGHDLLAQDLLVEQVLDPDPDPVGLVGIGRADPTAGGADRELAQLQFLGRIDQHVVGHDQVGVRGNPEVGGRDAGPVEPFDLLQQHARVDDHAVADHAELVLMQDAGGDQVELVLLVPVHDGVAGVVAALEAHDRGGVLGQQIGDLALAFVAPLGSDYYESWHE